MERGERIGLAVSGGAHAALILSVVLGDWLFSPPPLRDVEIAQVAMMSEAEFQALTAVSSAAPRAAPEAPEMPAAPELSEATPAPAPEQAPPEAVQPLPPDEAVPDDAPDVVALAPPQADVQDAPPNPIVAPVEEPSEQTLPTISPRPRERPADRVAPRPADAPEPDAAPAPDVVAATRPDEAETPVEEPDPAETPAAPEEAGTVLETEENRTDEPVEVASSAPVSSLRPRARPERAAATDEPQEADAVEAALNEALADAATDPQGTGGTGRAAIGPPLTAGETEELIVAVKQCWNLGALSTDALRTVVTVGVTMAPDGTPDDVRFLGAEGGTQDSAAQAFEAGRRAVLRCGARGFPLPPEKYDHWRDIEIVFNPEDMRLR